MAGERGGSRAGTATRHFEAGHPSTNGHFPGNPIIPGAVLLREVLAAVDTDMSGYDIRAAKFHQPVRPGETLIISWVSEPNGDIKFTCATAGSERPAVTGALHPRKP